jgi:hypothetical protein
LTLEAVRSQISELEKGPVAVDTSNVLLLQMNKLNVTMNVGQRRKRLSAKVAVIPIFGRSRLEVFSFLSFGFEDDNLLLLLLFVVDVRMKSFKVDLVIFVQVKSDVARVAFKVLLLLLLLLLF